MANYATLKAAVADVVKTNGTQAITGANLQSVLLSIINSVGGGYIFKGVATPSTSAGTPDQNVFYIAGAGTYANFGSSVTVPVGSIGVFKYNGSWAKEQIETSYGGVFDISAYHASGGTLATYADLAAALGNGGANVPSEIRKGGMCISFVHSSDNKYVQYLLIKDEWSTNKADWGKLTLEEKLNKYIQSDYLFGAQLEKNAGVVNASTGNIEGQQYSSNFYIRVPLAYAKAVDVQMFRTLSTYGLAFFDKNNAYIGGQYNNTEISGTRFKYDVPQGAEYMLYSYVTDAKADEIDAPRFSGVRLELNEDIIEEVTNKVSGILILGRDFFDMSQYGVVNITTGDIEGQSLGFNFYKEIDVSDCWMVDIPVFPTGSVYGVGFYDANHNYISGYANTSLPGGTRHMLNIPVGAKYFIFSYVVDAKAAQVGIPVFEYIKIYSSDSDTIGGVKLEISQMSGSPKRPRPQSGAESFSVNINSRIPSLDTNLAIGDTDVSIVDYGIIQLPENYSPTGIPVPLAIVCHGSGAVLSQYKNPVVVDGKAMGDPSKYLVQKGYACMDMFGLPESLGYGSELHMGNPRTLLCYLAGYEYVIKNYNVRTDKVFVSGSSMGGLSSFQIVQSGLFPVAAQAGFCPCIDLFKQAYCDPWGSSVRPSIATYFEFEGTAPTWTYSENTPPSQAEIDYFIANYEKIVGYNPIANMLMDGDYSDTFDYIPQDLTALIDATEKAIYDNFRATHPVPLKIWHCKNDYVVAFRYSEYIINMLRKAGRIAFLRPFNTGGHSAWDNGDIVYDTDVSGNDITTHVSERECFLWFERFK